MIMNSKSKRNGFTLIETMVSLGGIYGGDDDNNGGFS